MSKSSEPRAEGWLLMRLEQLTARPHTAAEILEQIGAAGWALVPRRLGDDPEYEGVVCYRVGVSFMRRAEGVAAADLLEVAYEAIVREFEARMTERLAVVAKLRALPPDELGKAMAG